MAAPRFLVDMNVSPQTVEILRQEGWDAIRVSDVMLRTASDTAILDQARQSGRVVVTHDLDFSTLLAISGFSSPSLITLRLSDTEPQFVARRLLLALPQIEDALVEGCAVTITDLAYRVRKLPIR